MRKKLIMTLNVLVILIPVFAGYDDDESIDSKDLGFTIVIGGILAIIGYVISQIKSLKGLGSIIFGLGAIIVGLIILLVVLKILAFILSAAFNIAIKLLIIGGICFVAYIVGKFIYEMFSNKKS